MSTLPSSAPLPIARTRRVPQPGRSRRCARPPAPPVSRCVGGRNLRGHCFFIKQCSGAPQAACLTTLVTLRPLLGVSRIPGTRSRSYWPSEKALDRGRGASCSSLVEDRYDPLLRHGVEGADGLGSLGYQTGMSEPKPDEHGDRRRVPRVAIFQTVARPTRPTRPR